MITHVTSISMIAAQFELHNRLYENAIEGLDSMFNTRPTEATNHLAWIAGHLVSTRHMLAGLLDASVPEPYENLFANGKGIDPEASYPSLEKTLSDWKAISPKLINALNDASPTILEGKGPFPTPMGEDMTRVLAFFAHHEAYHIGQMGILRKYFGMEAMKYNQA